MLRLEELIFFSTLRLFLPGAAPCRRERRGRDVVAFLAGVDGTSSYDAAYRRAEDGFAVPIVKVLHVAGVVGVGSLYCFLRRQEYIASREGGMFQGARVLPRGIGSKELGEWGGWGRQYRKSRV